MTTRTRSISNSDDILDSRDVIARIAELEGQRDALIEDGDKDAIDEWNDGDDAEELKALLAFANDGESLADWVHGVALINESYFETYAQEFADDIGAIDGKAGWPLMHIDWEAAAEDLKQDYTSIDFDGTTYYGR